jgi:hypothetical protein
VNVLDAEAELRHMLDAADLNLHRLPPARTWAVFTAFLRRDVADADDAASFQCGIRENEGGGLRYYLHFLRRFTMYDPRDGVPYRGLVLEMSFGLEAVAIIGERTVWNHDPAAVDEFAERVESLPEFQSAAEVLPVQSALWAGALHRA